MDLQVRIAYRNIRRNRIDTYKQETIISLMSDCK